MSALRAKGCTVLNYPLWLRTFKRLQITPERPNMYLVDTCGTGGDGANTFNISTAVAFVAASCGCKIAKYEKESASGKVSADVLSNLGLNLNCPIEKVTSLLKIGITFLFAPVWHNLNKLALRKSP